MVIQNGPFRGINPYTSLIASSVVILFVVGTLVFPDAASEWIQNARTFVTFYANWWYVLLAGCFLVFLVGLAASPYGRLRLGDEHERPKYSYFTWFAMVYAAGQGIGIIFWSIAEPVFHYLDGSPFAASAGDQAAARAAMEVTFFHWGLNAWAIYSIVALALAVVAYRMKMPLGIRYTLYPVLGQRVYGWPGAAVDVVAVFATLFGIATSLGLGVQQINSGLNSLWGVPVTAGVQLILIAAITVLALMSVLSGLDRGIRYLSEINMWLTVVLLAFFLTWGPTQYVLQSLVVGLWDYAAGLLALNTYVESAPGTVAEHGWQDMWQGWWTVFYWGWWISWAPFVGVFVARVSRGRTIREFVLGVVGVSTLLSCVWIAAYGGTALHIEMFGGGGVGDAVYDNTAMALYATFTAMDVGTIGFWAGVIGTILVTTYFVTSSDSGTLVLTTILSEGDQNPLHRHRSIWGIGQGVIAAVLLVVGGEAALSTLQTASIVAALPFSLIMVLMCVGIVRGLAMGSQPEIAATVGSTAD
ncbi:BCCT family transporter [Aquisalimonas lutea]|uniref:BCCT family transporter n=1 Tax=Aquisalimonas lutea TaxID=1327750 RepID=UPI0025B5AE24|nr:BCCT family transporter [Aquisalimonas lutea]MDN3519874.1 BCCT family transporter [Aquisalimonas lutea]